MVSDYLLFYCVRWTYTGVEFRDVWERSCFEEFKDMTADDEQIPVKVTQAKEWAEQAGNDGWVIKINEDIQFGGYRVWEEMGEGSEYNQNTIYGILRELLKILKKENNFINRLFRNF